MKLFHSGARALTLTSPRLRACKGSRSTYKQVYQLIPHNQPWYGQCALRPLTSTANCPSPSSSATSKTINDTPSQIQPSPNLSKEVRLLMRHVPHPVAIITATGSSSESPPTTDISSQFRGMTVSSFNTVTLTPEPVISFNVRRPSETLNALLSSGRFLVHLLAPNPATAALARDFARGNQRLATGGGDGDGMSGFEFAGIKPKSAPGGAQLDSFVPPLPMLRKRSDTSAGIRSESRPVFDAKPEADPSLFPFIFECQLLRKSVVQVYDHTIVVGAIVNAITGVDPASEITSKNLCLTYANTKFYGLGDEIS